MIFSSLFSLTNIIKSDICFTKFRSSAIDLFLTNKPLFFQKTNTIETGLSDHQKLICTFLKSCFERLVCLLALIVYCRNYKKFNEANFLNDVKNCDFSLKTDDPNENYDFLTSSFISIVNEYSPLKKKFIMGNQAPFMTRSRFRNKFCKNSTERNKCVALRRKCIKEYFHHIIDNNIVTNKILWNFIKPFLIKLNSCEIMLRKEKNIINDTKKIVEVLNDHYINIVEKSCGEKPISVAKQSYLTDDIKIVVLQFLL